MSLCLSPCTWATDPTTLVPSDATTFQPCSICSQETGSAIGAHASTGHAVSSGRRLDRKHLRSERHARPLAAMGSHTRRCAPRALGTLIVVSAVVHCLAVRRLDALWIVLDEGVSASRSVDVWRRGSL